MWTTELEAFGWNVLPHMYFFVVTCNYGVLVLYGVLYCTVLYIRSVHTHYAENGARQPCCVGRQKMYLVASQMGLEQTPV